MPGLQYLDNDVGAGLQHMGNSISRAAVGVAALRQQQQQQMFMNALRLAEMERERRLEGVRERLYGAQMDQHKASTDLDMEKLAQLKGLSKLADDMEAATLEAELGDIEGKTNAGGSQLTNTLRTANAVRRAALEKAVILGQSSAASRLRPFNVGPQGAIDPYGREFMPPAPRDERLYSVPPGHLLMDEEGEEVGRGLAPTARPSTARSAYDQIITSAASERMKGVPAEEIAAGLSMTNLLSAPVSAPAGTNTSGTVPQNPQERVVGKVYSLPKGQFRWTTQGWVKP